MDWTRPHLTNRAYTGQIATMARQLYRALPQPQQQVLDNAQAQELVNYKKDDQVAAVEHIIGLLGKELPMSLVSRLIKTLNDAIECKRGTTERLSTFVSRFWGLASTHLMHAQASQDSQRGEMLEIVLINNSTLDASTLVFAKLELISAAVRALDQNKAVSESPFNHPRRRSEMIKPSIVKIRKVSTFLKKFVNAVCSLTRQNSQPSSAKRVVVKICDKASAKLEKADKESLMCLGRAEDTTRARLPAQNSFPTERRGHRSANDRARG
jgi:hypothetical protein